MNKYEKSFFEFLKEYKNEPNVPDYNGEYPQPYELTIEDAELILNVKNKLDKEIERLNNIINELEKWLEESKKYSSLVYSEIKEDGSFEEFIKLEEIKNKLKELKEGK